MAYEIFHYFDTVTFISVQMTVTHFPVIHFMSNTSLFWPELPAKHCGVILERSQNMKKSLLKNIFFFIEKAGVSLAESLSNKFSKKLSLTEYVACIPLEM